MLRVTIEIVPFGCEETKRVLGVVNITNIQKKENNKSNYNIDAKDLDQNLQTKKLVKNFDRDDGFWKLCFKALKNIIEDF